VATALAHEAETFRHEALLYAGDAEFAERVTRFVRAGVEREEPVLVVVAAPKIGMLRDTLGDDARAVTFADMDEVGANPARIIPAWYRFVATRSPGRSLRGVGEPISPGRVAQELVECQRHEALLNVAFAGSGDWSLLCPYDTALLPPDVVDEALRTHPFVHGGAASPAYRDDSAGLPAHPLPSPPAAHAELRYGAEPLDAVHDFVRTHAAEAGLAARRVDDLDTAVHELAINSLRHAPGRQGVVAFWTDGDDVVCEVRDDGRIEDPLVGRVPPRLDQENGRGLWIVNQLCDLVQVRSSTAGTVVRVRVSRESLA
jgi:anti-sigma regulatory factor (Ser/Thr protein kinase)